MIWTIAYLLEALTWKGIMYSQGWQTGGNVKNTVLSLLSGTTYIQMAQGFIQHRKIKRLTAISEEGVRNGMRPMLEAGKSSEGSLGDHGYKQQAEGSQGRKGAFESPPWIRL